MSEFIKKRIIKDLIDELANVDAVTLEIIGHKVIETIEHKPLIHHGINKDYKPVGYTVDTFSQDMSIIGEYSTTGGYFQDSSGGKNKGRFDKIENDVKHALQMAGNKPPLKIYLASSEEELESFRGKFVKTELFKKHGQRLNFLDARELAKVIFQSSQDNSQAADLYGYYLPDFKQNLDNYEYYGRVPPACFHHQSEPAFLEAIHNHLAGDAKICVVHGLSGSGKTQAAIDFVHATLPDFGNFIWIAGDDWDEGVPLTAVKRSRGGVAMNVAGVFNSTRTLLVVDNLNRPLTAEVLAELAHGFALGGRVLVTSQLGDPASPIHLPMPRLSQATAYRILDEDEGAASDICRQFVEECRFCPLILAVTREIAKMDGIAKEDVYREVLSDPNAAQGEDGAPIMGRILRRLSDTNRQALHKIANSGCTNYDSTFLTYFIGPNARAALQRLAVLNRTATSSTLAVHDLICSASRGGTPDSDELANVLEEYVERYAGEMVPSVLRQIHLSTNQLVAADERRGERPADWLTYAILQLERSDRKERYARLQPIALRDDMPIAELLCIVDGKEQHSYALRQDERQAYYQACADEYGRLARATDNAAIHAEMLHHQGKALRRCGQMEAALACFHRLLVEKPEWHATYGQIAHLGSQHEADEHMREEGEKALHLLFDELLGDVYAVPLRVSLAAISRLRSYPILRDSIGKEHSSVQQLADAVSLSALGGFDQFYEAFLAMTSLFGYRHGEVCLAVAEAFPDMVAIFPNTVDERQWVNACEALTNLAGVAIEANKFELARKLCRTAGAFARELACTRGEQPYVARLLAKTFNIAGCPEDALAAVHRVPEQLRDHWLLYQKTKAESALGRHAEAIATSRHALDLASADVKAQGRLAIYHDLVSRCLEALTRLPEAIGSAKAAYLAAGDDQYRESLRLRLECLKRQQV